jgi:transposase
MNVYCGIDWADDHHDVALVSDDGQVLARCRISDDTAGLQQLLRLLAEHGDAESAPIEVAIETPRGLLVACLRSAGRPVFAINPLSASRYRSRTTVSGSKSDHADAVMLASILRTDRHAHHPLPADSELVQAIAVLARAHQEAIWERTSVHNKLRAVLREFYPAVLDLVDGKRDGLLRPEVRALLVTAPTPAEAARLSTRSLTAVLHRAGRHRGLEAEAARMRDVLRRPQLRQPPAVEEAMGRQVLALVRRLITACGNADQLADDVTTAFIQHPAAAVITSFPGLGPVSGARLLAELGDDPSRFRDSRAVKAYAGASPITRASGKSRVVLARSVKNQRLASVGYLWAFSALTKSAGARAHYDRRRAAGDRHAAAQRNLFNRLLGCLHHCLATETPYDETAAFGAAGAHAA